jgi:dipeptidyl aminopeptidase/acylaminoacyl peptidase
MVGTIGNGAGDSGDRVAAVITWSGINDLAAVAEEGFGVDLLGCAITECPDAAAAVSPITHVSASDAPMLIVNSSEDPITPLTQATVMAEALSTAGVECELLVVPGSAHSTQLMSAAWSETVAFLDRHLRQ